MNKKGFSLVEVLAVFVIFSILLLITIPSINNVARKSRKQLYETQIKILKESANIFITDYINIIPIENNESITIELKLLKDMDIVNQDLKNPITDKYFDDDMLLTITNNNDIFTTTIIEKDSIKYSNTVKYKNHIILFKGNAISDNSSTNLKENFIVLNYNKKIYDHNEYNVVIKNKTTIDSTYSQIEYQINVVDGETVTTYTLTRQENCQTGICDI